MTTTTKVLLALSLAATGAACGPKIQPRPIMQNGGTIISLSDQTVAEARAESAAEQARLAGDAAEGMVLAMATCQPDICRAIARGEMAVGMTAEQVYAATHSSPAAWQERTSGRAAVLVAQPGSRAPEDALGQVVMVALQNGTVKSYTYREPQGLRTVASTADATPAGRAAAQAEVLLREGDDFALRGDMVGALDRYDRADVLRPGNPETTLKIAQALDKQLRPVEALVRYQLFLHQMELEKIEARGDAAAKMAEAIALAQQRIVVLERRR
jgi:hypothetical protein